MADTAVEEAALNEAADEYATRPGEPTNYYFNDYNYRPNNKSAAISWAQTFISSQYIETKTVDDLIAMARKIEAYLDGGTSV